MSEQINTRGVARNAKLVHDTVNNGVVVLRKNAELGPEWLHLTVPGKD